MRKLLLAILLVVSTLLSAQVTITMEQDGGVYKVPCVVNGAKMKFIFDTGAATVCLSESMAEYLLDNDYISKDDIIGLGASQVADGRIVDHVKINLKDIEIAGLHLKDVEAIVVEGQRAPLLLGQSAIQKIGRVSIEGNKLTIDNGKNDDIDIAIECMRSKDQYNGMLSESVSLLRFRQVLENKKELKEYYDYVQGKDPSYYNMSWSDFSREVEKLLHSEDNKLVSKSDIQLKKTWMLIDKAKKFEDQEQYLLAAETREELYHLSWDNYTSDVFLGSSPYSDAYKIGMDYYYANEFVKSVEWLKYSANNEYADAQYQLGGMYLNGKGVPQNYTLAIHYLQKAADYDNAGAQCDLGYCYANGYGVNASIEQGFKWTRKAHENGNKTAEANLSWYFNQFKSLAEGGNIGAAYYTGLCYYKGFGTSVNENSALKWFKIGAEGGDGSCQNYLAIMYSEGKGTNVDKISAIYWFKKSAEQGNINAQLNLASMYMNGDGVEQDYLTAYYWYSKAAEHDIAEALCEMGKMLLYGLGVKSDIEKAKTYFDRAAQKEYEEAYYILGNLYWQGYGVEQNYKTAVDWWYKCSRSYEDKKGIDYLIAIAWRDGKGRDKEIYYYHLWMSYCTNDVNGLNALAYDLAIGKNGWKKQLTQALIVIEEAIKLKPQDPNYYDSKGEFYSMQNNFEKAKEMWDKVKSLDASFYSKNNTELNKYILKQQGK